MDPFNYSVWFIFFSRYRTFRGLELVRQFAIALLVIFLAVSAEAAPFSRNELLQLQDDVRICRQTLEMASPRFATGNIWQGLESLLQKLGHDSYSVQSEEMKSLGLLLLQVTTEGRFKSISLYTRPFLRLRNFIAFFEFNRWYQKSFSDVEVEAYLSQLLAEKPDAFSTIEFIISHAEFAENGPQPMEISSTPPNESSVSRETRAEVITVSSRPEIVTELMEVDDLVVEQKHPIDVPLREQVLHLSARNFDGAISWSDTLNSADRYPHFRFFLGQILHRFLLDTDQSSARFDSLDSLRRLRDWQWEQRRLGLTKDLILQWIDFLRADRVDSPEKTQALTLLATYLIQPHVTTIQEVSVSRQLIISRVEALKRENGLIQIGLNRARTFTRRSNEGRVVRPLADRAQIFNYALVETFIAVTNLNIDQLKKTVSDGAVASVQPTQFAIAVKIPKRITMLLTDYEIDLVSQVYWLAAQLRLHEEEEEERDLMSMLDNGFDDLWETLCTVLPLKKLAPLMRAT